MKETEKPELRWWFSRLFFPLGNLMSFRWKDIEFWYGSYVGVKQNKLLYDKIQL